MKLASLFVGFKDDFEKRGVFLMKQLSNFSQIEKVLKYIDVTVPLLRKKILFRKKICVGNEMVWGIISANGVGRILIIEGKMNSGKYINLPSNTLLESAFEIRSEDFIFQQDGGVFDSSSIIKQ